MGRGHRDKQRGEEIRHDCWGGRLRVGVDVLLPGLSL
jgi:hypothetical protein